MKKYLLSIALAFAVFAPNIAQAQDATPRILSVSVADQGAFINWILEGEDTAATAYRVFQIVDGESIAIEDTEDLDAQFLFNTESLVADGPQAYSVALIDADGQILSTSETHATAFVSLVSESCEEPIEITWEPYIGLEITSQEIYIGQQPNDPVAEVFLIDASADSFSYTPSDDVEAGTDLYITLASFAGVTRSVSSEIITTTCGSVGIEALRAFLAVGPNPTSNNLSINLNTTQDDELTLSAFSADGRMIYTAPFNQQATIEVADWTNGLYIYQLSDDQGSVLSGKFLKN